MDKIIEKRLMELQNMLVIKRAEIYSLKEFETALVNQIMAIENIQMQGKAGKQE